MILGAFDFIQMSFADILDIILLGLIIFVAFRWLKGSSAISIFVAIVSLYLIRVLVSAFNMRLIEAILNMILDVGVLAFIVIFQPEIRKFLTRLGNRYMSNPQGKALVDKILGRNKNHGEYAEEINNITEACRRMSEDKTGALIVLAQKTNLKEIIESGERLDATISTRLIENIFFKNTPLHDGALIIQNGQIVSAACILPVSKNPAIPKHMGLRHRAAVGLTEKSDATCIVVSEETGNISYAENGNIRKIEEDELLLILHTTMPTH